MRILSWLFGPNHAADPPKDATPVGPPPSVPRATGPQTVGAGPGDYYVSVGDPRFSDYPKQEPLLRALTVDMLLAPHAELIRRIDYTLSFPGDGFERIVMPMIRRLAAHANLIPASQSDHHCEPGGLLKHSLEAALYAAQLTDGMVFAGHETPQRRRAIEPLWRFAAFVASLLHDIGKAKESVKVTCPDGIHQWCPDRQPLTSWLRQHGIEAFRMTWDPDRRHKSHEKHSSILCPEILGEAGRDYLLSVENAGVYRALLEALHGNATKQNPLPGIIARADRMSIQSDFDTMRANQTPANTPMRMGSRLMQLAMKRLRDGYWQPNTPGQPIWVTPNGVYAVLPAFYAGIEAAADADNERGIPRFRSKLEAELARAMLIETDADGDAVLTTLQLPTRGLGGTVSEVAVRILRPDLLFGDVPPPKPVHVRAPQDADDACDRAKDGRSQRSDTAPVSPARVNDDRADLVRAPAVVREPEHAASPETNPMPEDRFSTVPETADVSNGLAGQGVAGEILRAILDANLATTGPVQVHLHGGHLLIETTGLVQQIGFASAQVIKALQEAHWLERSVQGHQLRYGFEVLVNGRARKVFAINREVSALAVQYAPRLFDASRALAIGELPQVATTAASKKNRRIMP